jgi:hypothetical protein
MNMKQMPSNLIIDFEIKDSNASSERSTISEYNS